MPVAIEKMLLSYRMRNYRAQRRATQFEFQGIVPNPKKTNIITVPTSEGENNKAGDDALSIQSDIRSFRKVFQDYG
ncbi:hypothetical protein PVK06_012401 [Gossypium arboreum]|uniref:Uncharacterized protein n=1 Tax=Gossypium arboreum TaxID=29729 RepID=A0ABR0QBG8_GOSAR|nr:hypothetical protein PVK06_012401 [Gossypium arboreum]